MLNYLIHKLHFLMAIVVTVVAVITIHQSSVQTPPSKFSGPHASTLSGPSSHTPMSFATMRLSTGVNLFLTFSYNITNPATIAKYYSFVWGAQASHVAALHGANPNMLVSYYIPFHRDSGSYAHPDLVQQHDLHYWRAFEPDWILYKCDRTTPAYEDSKSMPLDFTNPAMINWQVRTYAVLASLNGYDAIAADNVNMQNTYGACGFYRHGQWVQRYDGTANDPHWRNDVLNWLTQMQIALHRLAHPLALIPNLDLSPVLPSDPFAQQILSHIDGILDEGGFTEYGQGYLTDTKWQQMVHYIQSAQQQKKPYYIIDEVPSINAGSIQWNFGTYLLCNEGRAALFISRPQSYGNDTRYPEYTIPIGEPTNEMYRAQNVYWRNYSGGLVVVNPSGATSYMVTAPSGNYVDANGKFVSQTFTLLPHSAMILLSA